ncbi:MAG: UDP-glucose 4-epimerase GalE [Bacteroidetes bacterium]|nr:MAG: UDP-glucose 4-epimerase GalE [Bacteroidota bacterium]
MANKILVTGGCGYIGSHTIIELLQQTDYQVVCADNLHNSSDHVLEIIEKITSKKIKNYAVNLCDLAKTEQIFAENPDFIGVIHFAALKSVPESVADPLLYYKNNLESLSNILKCCEKFKVKNLIFSSSCSVYGNVNKLPVNEENILQKAECAYAHSKQVGEQMIEFFVANAHLNAIALRYFNPVGAHISGLNGENPRNKPTNLAPVITQTAVGKMKEVVVFGTDYDTRDGSCIRDYVHVSDIANAHLLAINYLIQGKNTVKYDVMNLGSGEGVTVLEAIQAFEKVSGVKLNYRIGERRAGDVAAIYSDNSKVQKTLGWTPKFGIEDMMLSSWKWQLALEK